MKRIFFILSIIILLGCESVYYPMTSSQIQQIKLGITPSQLIGIRGEPMKISTKIMGRSSSTGQWQALIYCYKLTSDAYDVFYFHLSEDGSAYLSVWETNCTSFFCKCDY